MMRSTLALTVLLVAACGQPASPASTAPVPTASATSPLYVPARPADLDVALSHDGGASGLDAGGAPISNADSVVASLRPKFRLCYQQGLQADPSMAGKVVISAKVDPNGSVVSADVGSGTGLSTAVTTCLAGVVKDATFSPPGGTGSTLQIPITFEPGQGK
jgi:hypothetical protein